MDGSAVNGNGYDNAWHHQQQVEYNNLKAQQQLTKQHFVSPSGSPQQYHTPDEIKPDLGTLNGADYSEMERLSSQYQPEVEGPLIGELRSTKALEIEYANADPAFVTKTRHLTPKYAFYRTVRGDGNCGWRAVAYGLFERLLHLGDINRIYGEHARIKSMDNLLIASGLQEYLFEDFAAQTYALFTEMAAPNFTPETLLERFNDREISDGIITHLKFLTSSWMKANHDLYQPWLQVPVANYCSSQIEPYGVEIEDIVLMALIDCLIKPAGFAVEVHYLDRSVGDEVNTHRFEKNESEGVTPPDAPVVRILYRPGHYDLIYKEEEVSPALPPPAPPVNYHVAYVDTMPQMSFQPTGPLYSALHGHVLPAPEDGYIDMPHVPGQMHSNNFRQSMYSVPEFQPSPFQPQPFQTTTFRNSPFNPSHFQSENFQPEIYQPPGTSSKRGSH